MLNDFFNQNKEGNKLLKAVHSDLSVHHFIVGCRALGLVSKAITEPLWKAIEKPGHILEMNCRYVRAVAMLEKWMNDPTTLLTLSEELYDDIPSEKDQVAASLTNGNFASDAMTSQVLGLILAGVVSVSKHMLQQHLAGGEFTAMTEKDRLETTSVRADNIGPERDFSFLDRSILTRPSLHTVNLEGLIMFGKKKVSDWIKSKAPDVQRKLFEAVRRTTDDQRTQYLERAAIQAKATEENQQIKKQEKDRKEARERVIKTELSEKTKPRFGGLWTSKDQAEEWLKNASSDKEKREALEVQLKFRKCVLKNRCRKGLLNFSSGSIKCSVDKLCENLMSVLDEATTEINQVREEVINLREYADILIEPADLEVEKQRLLHGRTKAKDEGRCNDGNVPKINVADDLVGKKVEHLCMEEGKEQWFEERNRETSKFSQQIT